MYFNVNSTQVFCAFSMHPNFHGTVLKNHYGWLYARNYAEESLYGLTNKKVV